APAGAGDLGVLTEGGLRRGGGFVEAAATAGLAPPGLRREHTGGEVQRRPPDRDDGGGRGRPLRRQAGVAGGNEVADARLPEVPVVGRFAAELGRAPAVGDVAGVPAGVVLRRQEVG